MTPSLLSMLAALALAEPAPAADADFQAVVDAAEAQGHDAACTAMEAWITRHPGSGPFTQLSTEGGPLGSWRLDAYHGYQAGPVAYSIFASTNRRDAFPLPEGVAPGEAGEGRVASDRMFWSVGGVVRVVEAMLRNRAHPAAPHEREIHRCSQRHQSLVGANVGRSPLAFDVLLERGQGKRKSTRSARIHRFPRQAAG